MVEATGEVGGLYQTHVVDPRCGLYVLSSCKTASLYGKHGYCRKLSYCKDICPGYIRKVIIRIYLHPSRSITHLLYPHYLGSELALLPSTLLRLNHLRLALAL